MAKPNFESPDLALNELFNHWPETVAVFLKHGMDCVGCLIGPFHTVMDACLEYNLNEADFREELRQAILMGING